MTEDFGALVASLDYPVFIATAASRGEQAGCLIGFATQASIHPARFLACLSKKNRTYEVAENASHLAVHVVDDDEIGRGLAELFGGETGDDVDKFASVSWRPGPGGVPVLEDCERWFAGRVLDRFDLGDHVGFLLEPVAVDGDVGHPDELLTFQEAKDIDPGHPA